MSEKTEIRFIDGQPHQKTNGGEWVRQPWGVDKLEELVVQWAHDKGIMEKATPIKQGEKTGEEYAEMMVALGKQQLAQEYNDKALGTAIDMNQITEEIKDAIGDQVVTLIIQCAMQGLTLSECLQSAYDIIAKRTGKMVDGKFVKDK